MALAGRPESFLPAVKCSTCGEEIDIVNLADHVCRPSTKPAGNTLSDPSSGLAAVMKDDPAVQSHPPLQSVDPAVQQGTRYLDALQPANSPANVRPGKNVPPQIDSAAANRPFLQPEAAGTPGSDYSSYTNDQGLTPITPSTQITTPSSMFSRKPSYPSRAPSPPSPDFAINLDSAFPPFRSKYDAPNAYGQQNFMKPPASPGANVLQRMDGIANGPFSMQRSMTSSNAQPGPRERRPSNDQYAPSRQQSRPHNDYRRPSEPQVMQSQSFNNPGPVRDAPSHGRQVSSEKTRKALNSIDMFLQDMDGDEQTAPMLAPEQRSKTFPEEMNSSQYNPYGYSSPALSAAPDRTEFFPSTKPESEMRPSTSAGVSRNQPRDRFNAFKDPSIQNPFIPASRQQLPPLQAPGPDVDRSNLVTESNSPDSDPKSPWYEAPRQSPLPPNGAYGQSPANATRARSRTLNRSNEPTAVERFLNIQNPAARNGATHSPSDSSSSYASSTPSTAPTSVGSLSRNGSSDSMNGRRRAGSRPQRPDALPLPAMPAARIPPPLESPIDPAIHHMRGPTDPAVQMGADSGPKSRISDSPPRMRQGSRPDIRADAPPRFQSPISKGECRGCGTNIYGKSVKAADGRLTGRYHKECFVCKTCQAPFLTAEFYVMDNAPYCAQHYHELNGSLCKKCDGGIEGQYLETDRREKFHMHCFACTHCRAKLDMDYYEIDGRPYCERHALAIPRRKGPGAPAAERRRTRMMFM